MTCQHEWSTTQGGICCTYCCAEHRAIELLERLREAEEERERADTARDRADAALMRYAHEVGRLQSVAEEYGAARQREADVRWLATGSHTFASGLAAQPLVTAPPEEGE